MNEKICTYCHKLQKIDQFYTKGKEMRRDSRCKTCVSKLKKARYKKRRKSKKLRVIMVKNENFDREQHEANMIVVESILKELCYQALTKIDSKSSKVYAEIDREFKSSS